MLTASVWTRIVDPRRLREPVEAPETLGNRGVVNFLDCPPRGDAIAFICFIDGLRISAGTVVGSVVEIHTVG